MIIGNGMIASIFRKYDKVNGIVIFASGVSNSTETRRSEFIKENNLLKKVIGQYKESLFIYFSSCSLDDEELNSNPYHIHKKNMELLIQKNSLNYIIFRLPNIIGFKGNGANIINFLIDKIRNNEKFVVHKNATRNIVDIEHLYQIASYIISSGIYRNRVVNIAYGNNVKIIDIVHSIEKFLSKKSTFNIENKGYDLKINDCDVTPIAQMLNIRQPSILTLLKKYKG